MKNLVFLVSGGGGTLRFMHRVLPLVAPHAQISAVIGDRMCGAIDYAKQHKIASRIIEYKRASPRELREALASFEPELIVTNIHKIIDSETLSIYPNRFINLHYSLSPAFGGVIGMEALRRARDLRVGFVGGTCHLVSETVDAGEILQQGLVPVDWDTAPDLTDILFKISCYCLLGGVLRKLGECGKHTAELRVGGVNVLFSPPLPYRAARVSDRFWSELF